MNVRPLAIEDIEEISRIEESVFCGEAWTKEAFFTYYLRNDTLFVAAEDPKAPQGEAVTGYALLLLIPPEAELLSIATRSDRVREGIATELIRYLKEETKEQMIHTIHLEVRKSNTAAISLYEGEGFQMTGIRRNYYLDPIEDAQLMTWKRETEDD